MPARRSADLPLFLSSRTLPLTPVPSYTLRLTFTHAPSHPAVLVLPPPQQA